VTSAAGAWNSGEVQVVVEARDVGDLNRLGIEQNLATSNAVPLAGRIAAMVAIVST
jgi:hypothetical protein